MYEYYLCEFEYGYEGQMYQEVSNGQVIRYSDLDGNTITLEGSYGYNVVDVNPQTPIWAQ